ncbi:DUF4062 domain-containing protein [Labilibaculum sp. A4]|uniref:DUF4062 domain-containing protein n=1 Tax=Labilibaculum euxinus TaxID=2686357 RepID=UPI000F6200A5|nr:DUF4062 domain-containing protein [Labilibaculum euxinus]MDQ1771777.1 DUF4062 domain-containing protein [Labilibaculum euxinus]MWN77680.1 DUF4062 domain-containing protein [Labilibaculum euxinus]
MKKKLQIFISSTYTDLLEERQAAVQAVLRAGNIPAGMELFSAGNKSQLTTIKKWIDESDIYVLILGGRYGSLEPDSKLSYTEIEYRYALDNGKPLFAIVLDDEMMDNKVKSEGQGVLELDNQDKYKKFKDLVLSKVCRFCNNESDIKLSILESIIDIQNEYDLTGWIKGDDIPDNSILLGELEIIRKERDELQEQVTKLGSLSKKPSKNKSIGDYSYDEVLGVLKSTKITVPANLTADKINDLDVVALKLLLNYTGLLTTGVSSTLSNDIQRFLTSRLVPLLLNFGLVERQKMKNTGMKIEYDKFIISSLGNKFLSIYKIESVKK